MPGLKRPFIGIIITTFLTFAMYTAALDIQSGGTREFAGASAPVKAFIYSMGGKLGPDGSLIVGGVITLFMVGWLLLKIRKSKVLSNKA